MCQHCANPQVCELGQHTCAHTSSCAGSPQVPTRTTAGRTQRHSCAPWCVDRGCHSPGTITGPGVPVPTVHSGAQAPACSRSIWVCPVQGEEPQICKYLEHRSLPAVTGSHDCSEAGRDLGQRGGRAGRAPPAQDCGFLEWGIEAGQWPCGCRHPLVFAPPVSSEGLTQSFRTSPEQSHGGAAESSGPIALTAPSRRSWADRAVEFRGSSSLSGMIFYKSRSCPGRW